MSTVVFTLRDGLFEVYYFTCNQHLVEIYLSRVSFVNFLRIVIILCFCDRVLCALLETSCVTNFRYTQLQCRGMGSIWLMSELPCKNLLSRENSFKSHYYHDRTHRGSTVSTAYKALRECLCKSGPVDFP